MPARHWAAHCPLGGPCPGNGDCRERVADAQTLRMAESLHSRLRPLGQALMDSVAFWARGSPAATGVPRFLGYTGGGTHHAVSRAFVHPRSRTTYALLRPAHLAAAAIRWPSSLPPLEEEGSPLPMACWCPFMAVDWHGRPLTVQVDTVDLDTFLAPDFLPAWRSPSLLGRVKRRVLRVCECLLLPNSGPPPFHLGACSPSLLDIPILGTRLRANIHPSQADQVIEEVD